MLRVLLLIVNRTEVGREALQLPGPCAATGTALRRSLRSQLRARQKSAVRVEEQSGRGALGFREGKGIAWGEGEEQDTGLGRSLRLSGNKNKNASGSFHQPPPPDRLMKKQMTREVTRGGSGSQGQEGTMRL